MDSVFILWHRHKINDDTDDKLIGVYKTPEDANAAITRLVDKPGFRDAREGFEIDEYVLGRDHWTEGYYTAG